MCAMISILYCLQETQMYVYNLKGQISFSSDKEDQAVSGHDYPKIQATETGEYWMLQCHQL